MSTANQATGQGQINLSAVNLVGQSSSSNGRLARGGYMKPNGVVDYRALRMQIVSYIISCSHDFKLKCSLFANKFELVVFLYVNLKLICAKILIWRNFIAMDVQERI